MPASNQEPAMPDSRAERVLARYLERRAAGEEVSLETLCGENPSIAGELRALLPLMDAVLGELRDSSVVLSSRAPHPAKDVDPGVTLDAPPPSDGSGSSSKEIL